jgi:hypothetical protein
MATVTMSAHVKYALMNKQVNLSSDSLKILLMRNGFVNSATVRGKYKNIKGYTASIPSGQAVWASSGETITRSDGGSFITDGFVIGNSITCTGAVNSANNAANIITNVTALVITCSAASYISETSSGAVVITANDELATGNGYVSNTAAVTGATLTEDAVNNRGDVVFSNVTWTATGGSIGPTPGAIIYDVTDTDNSIIAYVDFGGNLTAASGQSLIVSNFEVRLT